MQPLSISQLYERYNQLRARLEAREITLQQFTDLAHKLQAQDQSGNWWTIDPQSGQYMTFANGNWTPASPPVRQAAQATRAASAPRQQSGCRSVLGSPLVVGMLSFGAAGIWFAYTSLSPSSEGMDLMTPAVIAGMPLLMRLLQKPLDKLLAPLYKLLAVFPRPLLTGAAFAVPLVLGGVFTRSYGSGYQALQRSAALSVIAGYILSRRPEVKR